MESDKKFEFKRVIEYFAYAAVAIQAVFAAFWLFKNIGVLQNDYIAHTYILAAESLKVDDSMGILYALLLRILGHGAVLQIFQILLLDACIFLFAGSLFEKRLRNIVALIIVTNPLILQAETAVSPNALVLACVLAALWAAFSASSGIKRICIAAVASLAAGLLNPDYAYLFLIAGIVYFLADIIRNKRVKVVLGVAMVLSFAIPVLVNGLIRDDRAYGRVHRSPEFLVMQRVVWPRVTEYKDYLNLWEESEIGTTGNVSPAECDKIPENLSMDFAYKYEGLVGPESARSLYSTLIGRALKKGPGYWGYEAVRDELLYFLAPGTTAYVLLKSVPNTSVSSGLDYLFKESPAVFKTYYLFSAAVTAILTVLYLIQTFADVVSGRKLSGKLTALGLVAVILLISLYATFICVREYDYRNVLFMVVGWLTAVIALTERKKTVC